MKKKIFSVLLILSLLVTSLAGCGMGSLDYPYGESNTQGSENVTGNGSQKSSFFVHFIDVGQADAALILCSGKTMLIDGGNKDDSNLIYAYLQKLNITHLDYVVCTHAHEDHVGGLAGALTAATVGTVFAPVTDYDSKAFRDFAQKTAERGREITVPKAGDVFNLGDSTVTVLGPRKSYSDTNNTSIVLRVVYGGTSFLFTGDMESDAEIDLLESGVMLRSTVLKVGHHGSSTSTSYRFLREVAPKYAVISVGKDNQYDHPNEEVLSRLRDADVILYRTDMQGDVVCVSDGTTVSFVMAMNADAQTNPTELDKTPSDGAAVSEYAYIGNLNTKKYHKTDCTHLPNENNRIYFTAKQEAVDAGYEACGACKP